MATPLVPLVGRDAELAALAAVVGLPAVDSSAADAPLAPCEPAPPLVVVYGGVSAGKSRCVLHALRGAADHFALVDCTGVMTTRAFYKEVLGQLQSNARGRRPRRESSGARALDDDEVAEEPEQDEEQEQEEVVTITDAPPEAQGSMLVAENGRLRRAPQRRRKRRVDEERKGDHGDDTSEEEDDGDASDDSGDDEDTPRATMRSKKQPAAANPTETKGQQDDALNDGAGPDPAHGSLNFLSFVKALRGHMDGVLAPDPTTFHGPKRTVFIALDHVETLLDRGFEKLITCLLAVNDQLDYLHVFDANGAPWRLCVILIARAVSLNLDLFLHGAHPAFIHFPAYTKEEVAAIVTHNLLRAADASVALDDNRERAAWLRKWLVGIYDLIPHCHNDWLEFQHVVVQMLPSFSAFFDLVSRDEHGPLPQLLSPNGDDASAGDGSNRSWAQLQKASRERISTLEKSRRRHLFGYDNVGSVASSSSNAPMDTSTAAAMAAVSSGDPVAFIACSKLSRSCQLLLLASYLASFTPHEADAHFVSSSGGLKRKRRIHRAAGGSTGANGAPGDSNGKGSVKKTASALAAARKAMDQQLIGPKIFELPRLLAIYLSLQIENDALVDEASDSAGEPIRQAGERSTRTRVDIFTHLSLLVRLRLLQRASPPSDLDQPLFRCIADTRLVHEIARRLQFPLDSYLTTRG